MILEQYYGSITVPLFSGQNEQMALLLMMIIIIKIIIVIDIIKKSSYSNLFIFINISIYNCYYCCC